MVLIFLSSLLISFSIVFFLIGYAFLNDKAEDILLWSFTGKLEKVNDKEGYKKQQGKNSILMGIIFLLAPVSLYLVDRFDINSNMLRLWLIVFAGAVLLNAYKLKKYFK